MPDAPLDDLTVLGEELDLAFPLVDINANMVHVWPLPSCGVDRGVLLWSSVCHHVKREASRFIPSFLRALGGPAEAHYPHHTISASVISVGGAT